MALETMSRYATGQVNLTLSHVKTSICLLPGCSTTAFCGQSAPMMAETRPLPRAADFGKLFQLQDSFSNVIDANMGANEIGFKLKHAEIVTRDLVMLVRVSDLKTREALADALLLFVDNAKRTGDGLHRLSAKIDGAVDR